MYRIGLAAENKNLRLKTMRLLSGLTDSGQISLKCYQSPEEAERALDTEQPDLLLLEEELQKIVRVPEEVPCIILLTAPGSVCAIPPDYLNAVVGTILGRRKKTVLAETGRYRAGTAKASLSSCVIAYIEKHYNERCSVGQIADALFVSHTYLSSCFRKETGELLSTYIADYRMHTAARLLIETSMQVKEIAGWCGFTNIPYFSRKFRETYGLSPRDFRKDRHLRSGKFDKLP